MNDQEALNKIKNGDENALAWIYTTYRNDFIAWAIKNFGFSVEKSTDLFIDCLVVVKKNVLTDKLQTLSSTLKTYIIAIAKNIVREDGKTIFKESDNLGKYLDWLSLQKNVTEPLSIDEFMKLIMGCLNKLGSSCKKSIILKFLEGHSDTEIMKIMDYKSEDVVKNMRSKCLKKLRACLNNGEEDDDDSDDNKSTI